MKTALLCFWFAFAAVQVGLAFSFHSLTFIEIGAVIPLMIAFNLQRVRSGALSLSQIPVGDLSSPSALDGALLSPAPLAEGLAHSHAA